MDKRSKAIEAIMTERFGKDSLMALATAVDNVPFVRTVNACYKDGAFYVITYALSGKMQQIGKNPQVALSGEWFTANGKGVNLGFVGKAENAALFAWLREMFAAWIDNGHNNFEDEHTVILKIALTEGVLFHRGIRYEIDFS